MYVRRIVTGFDANGRSIVAYDGPAPRTHDSEHVPGYSNTVIWATHGLDAPTGIPKDPTPGLESFLAEPGGSRLVVVRFPPSSVFASADAAAVAAEHAQTLPGLAERFDPDRPGFHATPSVDYAVVLAGELWLELEGGADTFVRQGDIVIQNGTPHAWHNRTSEPAVLAAVMIGSRQPDA